MRRRLLLLPTTFLCCLSFQGLAQPPEKKAIIKGRLLTRLTLEPAPGVQVTIPYLKLLTLTDNSGAFNFSGVPYGRYALVISGAAVQPDTFRMQVNEELVDLKELKVAPAEHMLAQAGQQLPVIALEDGELNGDEDGGKAANISGILTAARDPFLNAAGFVLGQYRFRLRGYDQGFAEVQINGAPMNDIETGDAYWSLWGGLNDVFRSRSTTYGLGAGEYAYGGTGGSTYFDAIAASQRKQTRISYSATNRQYRNRVMLTHSTGLLRSGWAFSVAASRRWARAGYVAGTFYDGYSFYAAASKRLHQAGTLSLTVFGAPTSRGKMAPSFQEAYELTGNNFYNPNWGYQQGQQRNAKVSRTSLPVALLNYEYTPDRKLRWNTVLGYQAGTSANSNLDWYNAADPRPDYYRNLPSYYQYPPNANPVNAALNKQYFLAHSQLQWDQFYEVNRLNRTALFLHDGTRSTDSGARSLYVLSNDVDAVKKWIFNSNYSYVLNEHATMNGGLTYIHQQTESYRELSDLLGGDFYLNINAFTERNYAGNGIFNRNNLDNPDLMVREGDKYYYHYRIHFQKAVLWQQLSFSYQKVDFFIAGNAGFNAFQREGLYRNGLFAAGNESLGKGAMQRFSTYGLKGGLTYKINGRHYLFANASLASDAPGVDNTYFSPRLRNATVHNPQEQMTYSVEGGYLLHTPAINARAVGYVTDVKDEVNVQRFYYNGSGGANNFVSFIMQHMDTRFMGVELALDYKISSSLSVTGVSALGSAFYTNNPVIAQFEENTQNTAPVSYPVFTRGHYLGVGPQSVYSLGLNYRSKNYWYLNLNGSYLDRMYVSIAAPRRTTDAADLLVPGSKEWHELLDQERLPAAFTLDLSGGKSFLLSRYSKKIPRNTFLYINLGIGNLLDNQQIRTSGFENLRYDYSGGVTNKFAPKYFYAYGRNFFVNISLKF